MQICICDDDKLIHKTINLYCQQFSNNFHIEITDLYSAEELINKYQQKIRYDIIFLDIEMAKISGIEAAEKIKKIMPNTIIIFISNHPKYVFDSFKVEPLHFLVKPISEQEFSCVFQRALHKYKTLNASIVLKWQSERYVIKINKIKYIEGYKRHITVYTENESFEAIGKIPDIQKLLEPYGFVRTHQGFLVNMDFIKRFDINDVVLFDNTKVMLSVRRRTIALKNFDEFLLNGKW